MKLTDKERLVAEEILLAHRIVMKTTDNRGAEINKTIGQIAEVFEERELNLLSVIEKLDNALQSELPPISTKYKDLKVMCKELLER